MKSNAILRICAVLLIGTLGLPLCIFYLSQKHYYIDRIYLYYGTCILLSLYILIVVKDYPHFQVFSLISLILYTPSCLLIDTSTVPALILGIIETTILAISSIISFSKNRPRKVNSIIMLFFSLIIVLVNIMYNVIGLLLPARLTRVYDSPKNNYRAELSIAEYDTGWRDTYIYIYENSSDEPRLLFGRILSSPIIKDGIYWLNLYDSSIYWIDEESFCVNNHIYRIP